LAAQAMNTTGLRDRELALRTAEPLVGLAGLEGQRERARVGIADVLGSHAQHAPGHVARITAAVEHAAQPVERGIGVGAAHRLCRAEIWS